MGVADYRLRRVGEQRDVDRRSWHQVGDELGAVDGIELVRLGKTHVEELARKTVPERRIAGLVHHAAKLSQRAVAEACAVQLHEQIAAAREQRAPAASALLRVEEQPADLGRAFEVVGERQQLVAECLAEFRARLSHRAQVIGIEGLIDSDLPEHLARAADFPRFRVLHHKHVEVSRLRVLLAREALFRPGELRDEGRALRRKVGKPTPRQLGHFVDRGEVGAGGGTNAKGHAAVARRRMVRALSSARSSKLSTMRYSSALWILPPRTPIVSTTGTPQAAILLPSHTPPDGCQAMLWPRSAPAWFTRLNKTSASSVSGLGGRPNPPCASMKTSCCLAVSSSALATSRPAISSPSAVRGRMLTRRMARSGTTLFGPPPSIFAGLIDRPGVFYIDSRSARSAAATTAFRPSSGFRPAWAERPRTTNEKLPLPGRAPASVPSGRAAGS